MGLLVSIFAYLGTVTAVIVTVVMSYDVFIYTPLHSINPQHTLTVAAKPSAVKPASSASAGKIAARNVPAASLSRGAPSHGAPSHGALAAKAASESDVAAERRAASARREAAWQRHMRRLARQARGREWASPQGPRVLGYAEEPPAGLYNAYPYQ
jgi:hypothetical protein